MFPGAFVLPVGIQSGDVEGDTVSASHAQRYGAVWARNGSRLNGVASCLGRCLSTVGNLPISLLNQSINQKPIEYDLTRSTFTFVPLQFIVAAFTNLYSTSWRSETVT